ncbi:uncharacterized protein [Haliotis asinina]|uniref:uncharacterized protein isoform X3 n=1 Tax=Haliotis asinina TaxID=109174 RepID=UPI003532586E
MVSVDNRHLNKDNSKLVGFIQLVGHVCFPSLSSLHINNNQCNSVCAMTHWGRLLFHFVLIRFLVSKGQTCSFMETTGQKGMDSLRSNSGNMTTDVDGCKTLCNTTELCIAGEFHSSTNKCFMYSLETSLTVQADTVFFRWNCPTGAEKPTLNLNKKRKKTKRIARLKKTSNIKKFSRK